MTNSIFDNKNLPVLFLANIQSFAIDKENEKTTECNIMLDDNQVEVAIFTETWLTDKTKDQLPFYNYDKYHHIRKNCLRPSGGVSVFVKQPMRSKKINIEVPIHLECIWVSLRPFWMPRIFSTIVVCAIYYPGSNSNYAPPKEDLILHIITGVQKLKTMYANPLFFIMGDFNDLPVDEICTTCQLKQIVNTATRKNAILDLILTNKTNTFYEIPKSLPKIGEGDHFSLILKPQNYVKPSDVKEYIRRRNFPDSAIIDFGRWLTQFSWNVQFNIPDANDKVMYFSAITWKMIEKFFPMTKINISNTDKEWMTTHIKKLIKQRQIAHFEKKDDLRVNLAKAIRKEIKKAKINFRKEKIKPFENSSPKEWYFFVNKIINDDARRNLNVSNISHLSGKSNLEITQSINNNFANICRKYPALDANLIVNENTYDTNIEMTTEIETYKLIKKFSKKSLGPDDLPQKILKEFAAELATPFTDIINCSLRTRIFPDAYKRAEIIPIPKCNPPSALTDLRPISKTPIGGKMIESKMMKELEKDTRGKLDNDQYGNTKGSGTTHYLLKLTDEAYRNTDIGKATTAITIDYSKAFDYVHHDVLVDKLIKLGVRGSIIKLIISFLCNRKHCTKFNGIRSEFVTITSGVPQGTVSGPRLFVILINGVKCSLVSNYKFVDDKTLAYSYNGNATNILQEALNNEGQQTEKDKMLINANKCNIITFNFSTKNIPPQNLTLNNNLIQLAEQIKLLGVIISNDLKWTENTSLICNKVNRKLYILTKLKQFGFTRDELLIAWDTILRPLTEYAAPLWHSGLIETDRKRIENLQKKALGMIVGIKYIDNKRYYTVNNELLSYEKTLKKLDLISLEERRERLTCNFALQTMKNEKHKNIFQEKENHGRNLRNKPRVKELNCNTQRYFNSAVPYMSRILNGVHF